MNLYEGMFLVDSAKFAVDHDGVVQQLTSILEKSSGQIDAHRPWQDGRLAYPIQGQRKGLHYLIYFRMDGGNLGEVVRACKLNETVLRHLLIKHPPKLYDAMVQALNQDDDGSHSRSSEEPKGPDDSGGDDDATTDSDD